MLTLEAFGQPAGDLAVATIAGAGDGRDSGYRLERNRPRRGHDSSTRNPAARGGLRRATDACGALLCSEPEHLAGPPALPAARSDTGTFAFIPSRGQWDDPTATLAHVSVGQPCACILPTQRRGPQNRATRATIAFLESDRPGVPGADDPHGRRRRRPHPAGEGRSGRVYPPRSERPLVRARTTAFVLGPAHTGRSQRRRTRRQSGPRRTIPLPRLR